MRFHPREPFTDFMKIYERLILYSLIILTISSLIKSNNSENHLKDEYKKLYLKYDSLRYQLKKTSDSRDSLNNLNNRLSKQYDSLKLLRAKYKKDLSTIKGRYDKLDSVELESEMINEYRKFKGQ